MMQLRRRSFILVFATLLVIGSLAMSFAVSRAVSTTQPLVVSSSPTRTVESVEGTAPPTDPTGDGSTTTSETSARVRRPSPTAAPTSTPTSTPDATATLNETVTREPLIIGDVGRAATARFAPESISIERIGVNAEIASIGITPEGQMEDPDSYDTVGWYRFGPAPGEAGRAILVGHLDSKTGPAVFYRLGELAAGDEVIIRSGGSATDLVYVVRESVSYPEAEVPADLIFGPTDQPELVLITCAGVFDRGVGAYDERRIVVADLRTPQGAESAPHT